jgi:hypothetical protein
LSKREGKPEGQKGNPPQRHRGRNRKPEKQMEEVNRICRQDACAPRSRIAASRLSICEDADMVVVMQNGKIVQIGAHAELLAVPGLYRRMYMRQMGMEELDATIDG